MLITNYSKLSVTNMFILLAERVAQLLFTHSIKKYGFIDNHKEEL